MTVMTREEMLKYVQTRHAHIARNKTNDVFCDKCMQACEGKEGGSSPCCGGKVMGQRDALNRCVAIINKIRVPDSPERTE